MNPAAMLLSIRLISTLWTVCCNDVDTDLDLDIAKQFFWIHSSPFISQAAQTALSLMLDIRIFAVRGDV